MEPFSLATFFVVKSLADAAIIGGASAAVTGFIGNATDRILCKQAKHFLDWQNKSLLPENHDVLKVLRFAMLKATTMLSDEVPEGTDTKNYKKELEEWFTRQTGVINELEKWATWKPSVYNELDKFLLAHEKLNTPTEKLGGLIAQEWITHIEEQIKITTPLLYRTYFNDGFINKQGNKLHWHNIVLTIFTDTIKNPDDKLGTRAYRALNMRFQTETKQELKLLQIELKQGFDNIIELISALQKGIPNHIEIKEAWELIKSQQKINEELREELRQIKEQQEILQEQLFKASTEAAYDNRQVIILREKIAELEKKYEQILTENIILKHEAVAAKRKEIDILKEQGKQDDLLAAAAVAMEEGRFTDARKLRIQSAMQKEALATSSAAEAAEEYFQLAINDNEELRYTDALIHYLKAASLQPQNGLYLNDLGCFLISMAKYNKAIDNLNQALKHIPADNPGLEGTIYNNLGLAYRYKGEYDKAIDYYVKALDIDKNYHGEEHPKIASYYNNIGLAYQYKNEYDTAIDYYQKALAIDKKYRDKEHPDIAIDYNNLGGAYHKNGLYDIAIGYYNQALTIDKKYYVAENPKIAAYYNNIGAAYNDKGEDDKAIEYFYKALPILMKYLGEEHPQIATIYNNIGAAYRTKGEYDKAIEYIEKALTIEKKYHGEVHPKIAICYSNLGAVYCKQGKDDKAIYYFQKAIDILQKFHPNGHPHVANLREKIAFLLSKK